MSSKLISIHIDRPGAKDLAVACVYRRNKKRGDIDHLMRWLIEDHIAWWEGNMADQFVFYPGDVLIVSCTKLAVVRIEYIDGAGEPHCVAKSTRRSWKNLELLIPDPLLAHALQ